MILLLLILFSFIHDFNISSLHQRNAAGKRFSLVRCKLLQRFRDKEKSPQRTSPMTFIE